MLIFKQFTFDSAHFLPNVPDGHKCKNIHGHTYHLTVYLEDQLHERYGWVCDFAEVKKLIKPIIEVVDHKLINEVEGLENPTCERLAVWLWDQIKPLVPQLAKLQLNETPTSGVIYEGK